MAQRLVQEILFVVASRRDFHSEFGIGDFDLKEFLQDSRREVREQLNQQFREAWDSGDPWQIEMAATEPYPCRLSTQDLVDLLKMPTVFGKSRIAHHGCAEEVKFAARTSARHVQKALALF